MGAERAEQAVRVFQNADVLNGRFDFLDADCRPTSDSPEIVVFHCHWRQRAAPGELIRILAPCFRHLVFVVFRSVEGERGQVEIRARLREQPAEVETIAKLQQPAGVPSQPVQTADTDSKREQWKRDPSLMLRELQANFQFALQHPEAVLIITAQTWQLYGDVVTSLMHGVAWSKCDNAE